MRFPALARRAVVGLALGLSVGLGLGGSILAAPLTTITKDDMTLGSAKAPVTVIEYASASCPHCARFNNDVFPAFKAKYIDTGKVRYAMREFLTPPNEVAAAGFLTARCAGPGQYFTILDQIFRGQEQMYKSGDVGAALIQAGKAGGVTEPQLQACLDDQAAEKALTDRVSTYMSRDEIQSTPTFVINGKKIEGETTLATLDAAIADAANIDARAHHKRSRR
jgi:protein-disulfide isomerase